MKHGILIAAAAFAAPLLVANAQTAGPAPTPAFKAEKCYGVARAGGNDCQTRTSSCAGTARRDRQADAWIYVPEGLCAKIAGGAVKAKQG